MFWSMKVYLFLQSAKQSISQKFSSILSDNIYSTIAEVYFTRGEKHLER